MENYLTISNVILLLLSVFLFYLVVKYKAAQEFLGSFNNREEGMSGRKLTAFGFALLAAYVHYEGFRDRISSITIATDKSITTAYASYIDKTNIVLILLIDVCVLLLALALIKVDDILKFKNGTAVTTYTQTTETTQS